MSTEKEQKVLPQEVNLSREGPVQTRAAEVTYESRELTVRERLCDFLIEKNVITREEVQVVSGRKIDELIVRTAHEFAHVPDAVDEQYAKKMRRILGLRSERDGVQEERAYRNEEIKELTQEMRDYLEAFKKACPEVIGMILCGSRMDPEKIPAAHSDVDTVLILQKGINTDPRTPEGEEMLYKVREFSDNTSTLSGFAVEIDELYAEDEFLTTLNDPIDESKLTWGWNPQIVRYIGGSIHGMDELVLQGQILESLTDPEIVNLKKQKIREAQEKILHALDYQKEDYSKIG